MCEHNNVKTTKISANIIVMDHDVKKDIVVLHCDDCGTVGDAIVPEKLTAQEVMFEN